MSFENEGITEVKVNENDTAASFFKSAATASHESDWCDSDANGAISVATPSGADSNGPPRSVGAAEVSVQGRSTNAHACPTAADECVCVRPEGGFFNPQVAADFELFSSLVSYDDTDAETERKRAFWRREAERECAESPRRVYVARLTGRIKIGITKNIARRLSALTCSAGASVELIGWVQGTRALESALHERFVAAHLHGEWFAPTSDVLTLVSAVEMKAGSREHRLRNVLALLGDGWWVSRSSLPIRAAHRRRAAVSP